MKKQIFVVEDQQAVRAGIVEILNREPDLLVCGEAADNEPGAISAIASTHPDLLLVDIELKSPDGIQLIRTARSLHPDLPIVAMTMFDPVRYERRAREAGANGFVVKQEGADRMIGEIRRVLS